MVNKETVKMLPPWWGDDSLTKHLDCAFGNVLATFVRKKAEVAKLIQIDGAFLSICENLNQPKDFLAALLILRAHSAYRAACLLVMSGQIAEVFPLLRACLEYSMYALHINQNGGAGETWLKRHDDGASLKAMRNEFTVRNVSETLKAVDQKLGSIISELYERTIDFGGHPNERAITQSLTKNQSEGKTEFQSTYLHGDSMSLNHGLKTAAQVGLGSLCIFRLIFAERFELLGINVKIDQLRKSL